LIDVSLILLALVGGFLALQSSRQRSSLSSQVDRIEKRIGSFPVSDPKLVHIQALETNAVTGKYSGYVFQTTRQSNASENATATSAAFEIAKVQCRASDEVAECQASLSATRVVNYFPEKPPIPPLPTPRPPIPMPLGLVPSSRVSALLVFGLLKQFATRSHLLIRAEADD